MPTSFRPCAPDQELLLQPSLREWLPESHLTYFIDDVVEELDLDRFYEPYEGDGWRKVPFEPRMMLKVCAREVFHGRQSMSCANSVFPAFIHPLSSTRKQKVDFAGTQFKSGTPGFLRKHLLALDNYDINAFLTGQ